MAKKRVGSSLAVTPLRRLLRKTAPVKLAPRGGFRGFVARGGGAQARTGGTVHFRGLTKRLDTKLFSRASLPRARLHAVGSRVRGWEGPNAGRRRGAAVDRQLSAIANGTSRLKTTHFARNGGAALPGMYRLTAMALAALQAHGLTPVCGQRGVCDGRLRIATAADLICVHRSRRELWLVEVKCGFEGVRDTPGRLRGRMAHFGAPLSHCPDSAEHRHMAQLTATHQLFARELTTLRALREGHGITTVRGCVLYVHEAGADVVELTDWWRTRASAMLKAIARD